MDIEAKTPPKGVVSFFLFKQINIMKRIRIDNNTSGERSMTRQLTEHIKVKLLQIWILPAKTDVEPRYEQMKINEDGIKNRFVQIVSPDSDDDRIWVHQQTWFNLGDFDQDTNLNLPIKGNNRGVYFFMIAGSAEIGDHQLEKRDVLGVWERGSVPLKVKAGSRILAMIVPMS